VYTHVIRKLTFLLHYPFYSDVNAMLQVYEGQWMDGKQHGHGCLRRKDGSVIHDGEWKDDEVRQACYGTMPVCCTCPYLIMVVNIPPFLSFPFCW
jgi:MORN repeat